MAIAHVASTSAQGNAAFTNTTSGINTTGANFLVATITTNAVPGSSGFTSFVDSKGNTWSTAVDWTANGGDSVRIMYVQNPASVGASHTVTLTYGNQQYTVVCFAAYSGMLTASVLDQTATGTGNSTALATSNTSATTNADDLLIACGTISAGTSTTFTAGTNFTMRTQQGDAASGTVGFFEDRIVSATGAYAGSATWGGVAGAWVAAVAAFKGTSAGGSGSLIVRRFGDLAGGMNSYTGGMR